MYHYGALFAAVLIHIGQAEIQRHLEIQLDGAALPGAAEGILKMEVYLRAVEGAVALVYGVIKPQLLQSVLKAVCSGLPVLIAAHAVGGAGGKLYGVFEAEFAVNLVYHVHNAHDLIGYLLRTHEDVGIVLSEAAHAE